MSDVLSALFFLYYLKKTKKSRSLCVLFAYLVFIIFTGFLDLQGFIQEKSSIYFYGFITLTECGLFLYFIWLNIYNKTVKKYIVPAFVFFTVFEVVYASLTTKLYFDSIPIGVETILILIFSFCFLYEQIYNTAYEFVYYNYRFWIVVGFMICCAGTFFIYLLIEFIPAKERSFYWMFTNFFTILRDVFFITGILVFALYNNSKKLSAHI